MMHDPLPPGALVDAPHVPPVLALRPVDPAARLAHLLVVFRTLQDARDDHEARCLSRALTPNPCHVLWSLDERLRTTWAEVLFLGGGLADLYQPRPCAPECADCADPVAALELRAVSGDQPHHAARCPVPDGEPCSCEAPVPAVAL